MQSSSYAVSKKILHPEDRIIRLPLDIWAKQLMVRINKISFLPNLNKSMETFAAALNQAALILTYNGQIDNARHLCYKAINTYATILEHQQSKEISLYQIQAWVNLGRLDRILKLFDNALHKFMFLMDTDLPDDFGFQPGKEAEVGKQVKTTLDKLQDKSFVYQVAVIEIAKICLASSRYRLLLEIFPITLTSPTTYILSSMAEAHIITSSYLADNDQAWKIASFAGEFGNPKYKYIFDFRRAEIAYLSGNTQLFHKISDSIFNFIIYKTKEKDSLLHLLYFYFEYAVFLMKIEEYTKSELIFKRCYNNFIEIGDELGIFLCLQYLSSPCFSENLFYVKHLIKLQHNTGYYFIRSNNDLWPGSYILHEMIEIISHKINLFLLSSF